jgi:hypothetical protein
MPSRKKSLSSVFALLFALAISLPAPAKTRQTEYFGELEPRLFTTPDLMSKTFFNVIPLEDVKPLGVAARPGDKIYSGQLSLPDGGKIRNIYNAVVVRSPDGTDVLYADVNRNGHFDPSERIPFLPVTESGFSRLLDMASFDVDLPPGGAFRTCPMQVALLRGVADAPAGSSQIAVEYTSAPFLRGFAELPGRRLQVRFQYDFETGGVSLDYGYEWLDLNGDGKFDMSPGSPELVHGNGSNPVFQVDGLMLQVESVNLKRDQFVLRVVDTVAPKHRRRPSLPFLGHSR